MTPSEVTKLLRDKGLCGHVSGDKPHEVACVLSIGHDGGEHEDPSSRWEDGFRSIVTILLGPSAPFEIKDVVEMVRCLRRVIDYGRSACSKGNAVADVVMTQLENEIDIYDAQARKARTTWAGQAEQRARARSYDGHPIDVERCVCGARRVGHLEGPAGQITFCMFHEKDAHALARSMGATIFTDVPL